MMLALAGRRCAPRAPTTFLARRAIFSVSSPRSFASSTGKRTGVPGTLSSQSPSVLPSKMMMTAASAQSQLPALAATSPAQQLAQDIAAQQGVAKISEQGLVLEFSVSWVFGVYQDIFAGLLRNIFQTMRPVLILFVFGQMFKMVFFMLGAPMLFSFYSAWIFETFYGLLQCVLSFIFICQFYDNISLHRSARRFLGTSPGMEGVFRKWHAGNREKVSSVGVTLWLLPMFILGFTGASIPSDAANSTAHAAIMLWLVPMLMG